MRELVFEILLRASKAVAATLVALIAWAVCVGLLGAEASATLGMLCWISGVALVLVVQESPI